MNNNQNNVTVWDELRHDLLSPFINLFLCALHMIAVCYFTALLWFAKMPVEEFNLLGFLLDWHILTVATFPVLWLFRKLFSRSVAFFVYLMSIFVLVIILGPMLENAMHNISRVLRVDGYHSVIPHLM